MLSPGLVDRIASPTSPVRKLLLLVDVAVIVAALALAIVERPFVEAWLPLKGLAPVDARPAEYAVIAALSVPLWLALASRLDLHSLFERGWTIGQLLAALVKLHALGFVVLATMIYATQVVVNRSLLGLFLVNSFALMLVYRLLLVLRRRMQHRRGIGRSRLLLVGTAGGELDSFVSSLRRVDYPPHIVGYLCSDERADDNDEEQRDDGLRRLGEPDGIEAILHDEPVDYVLFFAPQDRADQIERELLACERVGVPAMLAIDFGTPTRAAPQLSTLFGRPFVSLDSAPKRPDLLAVKHAFDFLLAAIGVIVLAPLLFVLGMTILVTMGRPIFFVQRRAGYRGRPFQMLKFRTMVVDAEQRKAGLVSQSETEGPAFKMKDDPRVTRLGRVLRKTSFDELPQLLNVLGGTMSLTGPRPLPLDEQQRLTGWHRRRLAMRPGISGLWQVSGRSDVGFTRWMELDLQYVDGWSLWLDVKILGKTIPVVLFQKGAN